MENKTKRFLSLVFALVMVMSIIVPQMTFGAQAAEVELVKFTFSYTSDTEGWVESNTAFTEKSYQENGYSLNFENGNTVYVGKADDEMGFIKFGKKKGTGTLTFTVPPEVTKVELHLAKYKDHNSKCVVNGTEYTLTQNSNDTTYNFDTITVDTSKEKTVTVSSAKVASEKQRMIMYAVVFYGNESTGGDETCNHDNQPACAEKCSLCQAELIPAANHRYSSKVTDPTCTTGGYTTYTCDDCDDSYTDNETPAAHNYVDGVCSLCGSIAIADGNYIISTNGLTFAALDESKSYGYAPAGDATALAETDIITITNVDGGFTMQDCYGRFIYQTSSYNSFNVSATAPAEGHIWQLKKSGNDLTMVNVLKQKTVAYSSLYTTWGAYAADKLADQLFALTLKEAPKSDAIAAYTSATTIWGQTWSNARESYAIKVLDASGNVMGTSTLNPDRYTFSGDQGPTWHITLPGNADADAYWIQEWVKDPTLGNMPAKVELWIDGVKTSESAIQLNGPDGINKIVAAIAGADGNLTSYATTFAAALTAAPDNGTVKLLSGPNVAISAAGEVTGNKTVTVTGTAKFDWGKGWLMVGRGNNPGDGKLIFKDATITSASSATNTALGFNISCAKKNSDTTCNGSVELINSNIETDYLLNAGNMTVDGGNLYVHHGFKVSGRDASESASGEDATATMTVTNGAVVKIKNENTMGIGNEGNGILNLENSTFECLSTMNIADEDGSAFNVSGTSTLNVANLASGVVDIAAGTNLTDTTIAGAGTVKFNTGVTNFYGSNTVTAKIDNSVADFDLVVKKGATLLISRYVLGYDRDITVYGEIKDAHDFDPTGKTPSLKFDSTSGVSIGGTDTGKLTVQDAYVELDSSSLKAGATGTYEWNFKNAYVKAASLLNTNAAGTGGSMTLNFADSVVASGYIKNGTGVTYNFTDGSVATTGSICINGVLNIDETSSVTTTAYQNNSKGAQDEHGDISGTVNVAGKLTIGSNVEQDVELYGGELNVNGGTLDLGTNSMVLDAASAVKVTVPGTITAKTITIPGTITIDATNLEAGKEYPVIVLDGTESLEGKVKFVGNVVATYGADGDVTIEKAVAKVGNTCYTSLTDAFKAVTADNNTVEILSDITITEKWDCRNTGSKFSVPVTIIGNAKTIKFTNEINDGLNFLTVFHFLDDATVKNLTIDMSEAVAVFQNRFSAIANQGDLTVENCTFIGSTTANRCRAIIYGESAANLSEMNVTITGSEFINWGYAVTDNMSREDAKSVAVTDNEFTNASVQVSAAEEVTFTGNTMDESWVTITTYENTEKLNVTATGNTLEENTEAKQNTIQQGNITAQEGFDLPAVEIAGKKYMTIEEAIDKADDGATVTLLEDVDLGETAYELTKSIVLNLNGKKLTGEIKLAEGVTLTADKALMEQVKTAENDYVVHENGVYSVADAALNAANMTLGDSFSLNFWVKTEDLRDGVENYKAVMTIPGTNKRTVEIPGSQWKTVAWRGITYYQIPFAGLSAKEMNVEVEFQIFNGSKAESAKFTESLRKNAEDLLKDPKQSDGLKAVLVDMLNYGAAAQKEFNYNTGNLANSGLTAEQQALATKSYDLPNAWNGGSIGYGSNLELKNEIILHVWFKAANVAAIKVNGVEVGPEKITRRIGDSIMSVAVTDLAVADGFDTVTVEFFDASGNSLGTVTESVASYLKYMLSKSDDTNGLYDATAKFITSSYNYFK